MQISRFARDDKERFSSAGHRTVCELDIRRYTFSSNTPSTPSPTYEIAVTARQMWDIWVDVGGTFTDCVARDPEGRFHRAKVLSTSALRGSVLEVVDERSLLVESTWPGPEGLVEGFRFQPLAAPPSDVRAVDFDPTIGLLRLDRPVPRDLDGSVFELRSPEEAPVLAARMVTGTPPGRALPPLRLRLATTRATNALLEHRGSPVAFFVTKGFADLLIIGTQQRPELFALDIVKPRPLHAAVIEVDERLSADGAVVSELRLDAALSAAREALARGIDVAAISLLHAYRNDRHERLLEQALLELGFQHVSRSSAVAPAINHLHRSETTLVNAYLAETLTAYLDAVEQGIGGAGGALEEIRLLTSAGGVVRATEFLPKDSLLSGPAGGVVGAAIEGRRVGIDRVISFDMGGTSTDVARYDGDFDYTWRHQVGDARLLAPALAIETVAAGGGSVCGWTAGALAVGPESAGAAPGPACYGAGGPLTITDCNLLLGRIDPARFGIPLSIEAAQAAFEALRDAIAVETGERPSREPLLAGLIDIADERMADAIRSISLRKGYDPSDYALVVFGGAGAQHGCGVARRLGITRLIIPPDAGILSAVGVGHARVERIAERQVLRDLGADPDWLDDELDRLAAEAREAMIREGVAPEATLIRRRIANLRLKGQETPLSIDVGEGALDTVEAFARQYRQLYGHGPEDRAIEVESLRVIASTPDVAYPAGLPPMTGRSDPSVQPARAWVGDRRVDMPRIERSALPAGARIEGPCMILDPYTSILVDDGWVATVHPTGTIILDAEQKVGGSARAAGAAPRAVREQLFTSRFESLVEEMGDQLRRTALSTNVKERLDFSCALLDADGELVANAPHIPVHLGALGVCVRSVARDLVLEPGDVVVTNHPTYGGSHLPDITVITPVHDDDGQLVGYVASRAHHAEVGGARPGSMPPHARSLAEEGVVIPPTLLAHAGEFRWDRIRALLTSGPYASRAPDDNIADLRAQVAANHRGAELLRFLAREHGTSTIHEQMEALTARAERGIRTALQRYGDGTFAAVEHLDDGSALAVSVAIQAGEAVVDFTGTAGVHPGNLNATPAIVRSALLYVLRLLIDEPLPLNEGLLRPVRVVLPTSLLSPDFDLPPDRAPAVVGGNTEVSQRLVDTLLRALGLAACSQGTMNNILFGDASYGYYETIAGGAGATPRRPGCSAVHTHMTNTRITDVEVLESRYPVRVNRFAIRPGSGGRGALPGGDGVVREIEFLRAASVSVLTQHRKVRPYGMNGGEPGAPGRQWVERVGGGRVELEPIDGCEVEPGDRLVVETPGGGGWGRPDE